MSCRSTHEIIIINIFLDNQNIYFDFLTTQYRIRLLFLIPINDIQTLLFDNKFLKI